MRLVGARRGLSFLFILCVLLVPAGRVSAQGSGERGDGGRESTPAAQSPEKNQQEQDENEAYRHSAMVGTLGRMMGMSTSRAATVFEVLNFAILAVVVGGFLVKMLPKRFRDRTTVIQKHLVDARTATAEASARLNSVEDRLSKLDGQIAEMRVQATRDAAAEGQQMKLNLEEETRKILASADLEISTATTQAQRHLQQYAAELAIEQAGRKLVVSAEMDRLMVQKFVRQLGGDGSKGGEN